MAGTNQVQAIIELIGEDKITKIVDSVERSFRDVRKEAKRNDAAAKKYGKTLGRVAVSVEDIKDRWAVVAVGMNAVTNMIGQAASLISSAGEQLKIAAQEGGVERRFQSITQHIGGAGNAMMALQQASSGALSETTIQKLAARSMTAGITLKQTADLFTSATKMASAGMGDQAELTEQLIGTFVERSDSMLKNMGIEADFGQTLGVTSKRLGVSTDAMNENLKRQTLLREMLPLINNEFGKFSTDTAVQALGRMDAAIEDLSARARKLARQAMLEKHDEGLQKSIEKTKDLMNEITGLTVRRGVSIDRLQDAEKKWPGLFKERAAAQSRLRQQIEFDAAVKQRVIMLIDAESRAMAMANPNLKTTAERFAWMAKQQALLAKRYGLTAAVLPGLKSNQEAFRKELGISAKAVDAKTVAMKELAEAQAAQHKLNVKAVTDVQQDTEQLTKNSLAQAMVAESMGLTQRAAELYKKAVDGGTLSFTENVAAVHAMIKAEDLKAVKDLEQIVLNAKVAASLGRNVKAAHLYQQAFSGIPVGANLATISVKNFTAAAAASTNTMLKMMAAQAEMQSAQLEFSKGFAMIGGVSPAEIAKQEKALTSLKTKMAKILSKPIRTGGGARVKAEDVELDLDAIDDIESDLSSFSDALANAATFEKKFAKAAAAADAGNQKLFDRHVDRLKMRLEHLAIHNPQEAKFMTDMVNVYSSGYQKIIDQKKTYVDASKALDQTVIDNAHASMMQASAAMGQVPGQFAQGLSTAIPIVSGQVSKVTAEMDKMVKAGGTQEQAIKKSVPGLISASGAITGAFIEDAKARAVVQGFFELAAAAGALAIGNTTGAALHALSSTLYFAVAAKTKSGGGGASAGSAAASARQVPATLNQPPQAGQQAGPSALTINFSGTVVGNDESAARELATLIRREMRWSNAGPSGAM